MAARQVTSAHFEVPAQVPEPSHWSFAVVESPSSHGVLAAEGSPRHVPSGPKHRSESKQKLASPEHVVEVHALADHSDGGPEEDGELRV